MKKKILATLLAGTMALSLAACGGSGSGSTTAAANNAASGEASEGGDAAASGWKPEGTVSIIVPAGAGGDTDLSARVFAQHAKEKTGVDFIVVNSNGAAGSVAANQVLEAAPDGMTVLYGHALVNVANVAGVTDYNYSAFKIGPSFALEPAQQLYVFSDKYADMDAFIEAAKAAPGQLKACTEVGAYTYYELLGFQEAAGIELDLVDAGSTSDKIAAMLSGQIDLMPGPYVNCKDYLEAGQFTCIGVPTDERSELLGDVPTLKEQGIDFSYPNQEFSFYFPKETPDEVIAWYDELTKSIVESEEGQQGLADLQMLPNYLSPADTEKVEEDTYNTIKDIADRLAK
ncbi:tripartite tricarboxylate transporter substrate binding protein [Lachnoclostridium edouardi]|uniref:tripartite tricarboxylate transporter substrate binding protein n=1 Tax=Lachnoclostridium edouardi TaxID=1926283 RepID=UPI000C79B670|nr:tripartite tricarboxylate transporter substrate binding protein [Lachnoclostridium edouardi]